MQHRLGIDVGGTHTDAVILDEKNHLVAKTKARTTPDVSSGIEQALKQILQQPGVKSQSIVHAMLGTTHCTNAITERKHLSTVGVIRLGAPATLSIPPLYSWPADLHARVAKKTFILYGGHEYDGKEISSFNEKEIARTIRQLKGKVESVAITGVFSPVNSTHEKALGERLKSALGDHVSITLSHEIGSIGILERENAAVLELGADENRAHGVFRLSRRHEKARHPCAAFSRSERRHVDVCRVRPPLSDFDDRVGPIQQPARWRFSLGS